MTVGVEDSGAQIGGAAIRQGRALWRYTITINGFVIASKCSRNNGCRCDRRTDLARDICDPALAPSRETVSEGGVA